MLIPQIDFALEPPPIPLGAMAPNSDQDGSFLIDATANMTLRATTIASIGSTPIVKRLDTHPITSSDIVVSNVAVLTVPQPFGTSGQLIQPGYGWTFTVTTNGNVGFYLIGFQLSLASGSMITRWAGLPVIPYPG